MDDNKIVKIAHEVNKVYRIALGDYSQPDWDDLSDHQKKSALASVAFYRANPYASPEDNHNEWIKDMKSRGWKHGEIKDTQKKEHPCIIPFNDFPQDQKAKDYIFRGIVKQLIKC